MKKIILILCTLVLPCVYFGVCAEEVSSNIAAPNLSVSPEIWDFGTVVEGDIASRIFLIKNTGNAELTINNVRSSCGCTAVLLSAKDIAPGQAAELKVSFNSSGYRSNFEKYVYLTSNDPDEPNRTIIIKGSVKALPKIGINVEPPVWDFASAGLEQPSILQFLIENRGTNTLKISSIGASLDTMNVSVASADIEPHKATKVDVNLKPQAKIEKKEGYISIKIDIPYRYPNQ